MNAGEVRVDNYTNRNTEAYRVRIGNLTLFFSYRTIVGFSYWGRLYLSENTFSKTTGRHLNEITSRDNKDKRLPRGEFEQKLNEIKIDTRHPVVIALDMMDEFEETHTGTMNFRDWLSEQFFELREQGRV